MKFNEFDEIPILIKDFIVSPSHMDFPTISERQLRFLEYMVGKDVTKVFDNGRYMACVCWGKGAGKDQMTIFMFLYLVYYLLCLKDPQAFLRLPSSIEPIDMLNMAPTRDLAGNVFFEKLRNQVKNWVWLKKRYKIVTTSDILDETKVVILKSVIQFPKHITLYSGNSEAGSFEGKNLIAFCFTGDTKIKLVDGTVRTLAELESEKEFYVYSYDTVSKDVVPGRAHSVRKTREHAPIMEVLLDNNETIRCTPDHKFLMRDGSYRECQELVPNDSLMPLYTRVQEHDLPGYEQYYNVNEKKWYYTHRMFWARSVGLSKQHIPVGVIYHKNGNKLDNRPENLQLMDSKEHRTLHVETHGEWHKKWWAEHPEHMEQKELISKKLTVAAAPMMNNHKVVSVTFAGYADVYDLTVDTYHNFALNAGVFVHNCLDEASDMVTQRGDKATEIYRMLRTSAVSRFGLRYKGFVISYPRRKDDFTIKMFMENLDNLNVYTDKGPTWEVKPPSCYSGKFFRFKDYLIPIEFKEDFDKDPFGSMTNYLCIPSEVERPFIEMPERIDRIATNIPLVSCDNYIEGQYVKKRIAEWRAPHEKPCVIGIDLGQKHDSAALSVMHIERTETSYYYVQDLLLTWTPDKTEGYTVSFTNVGEVITELAKKIRVTGVVFDQWNSAQLIEELNSKGISSYDVVLNKADYYFLKELIYSEKIRLVCDAALVNELKKLIDAGSKIDHLPQFSKDRVDSVVSAIKMLKESIRPDTGWGSFDSEFTDPSRGGFTRVSPNGRF